MVEPYLLLQYYCRLSDCSGSAGNSRIGSLLRGRDVTGIGGRGIVLSTPFFSS